MNIQELDRWFQELLLIQKFSHIDSSLNGVQVSHRVETIKKVAFAVDACLETFMRCRNADVLVVHHGLYWGREEALHGIHYDRIRFLMEHDIALYAIHLPLDAHPMLGNNYGMARFLGLGDLEPFAFLKEQPIGVSGNLRQPVELFNIQGMLSDHDGIRVLPFGKKHISSIAIVSGGGNFAVDEAIAKGIDLFITGDAAHIVYHRCLEANINVIFAGHYFTEIWGVKLLMEHFLGGPGKEQDIAAEFIDVPTGL